MTLRTLMQTGPAKTNELFTRLFETSETALKTREKVFSELKAELEIHAGLEEAYLLPALQNHPDSRQLVAHVAQDIKDLRKALVELEKLPKNHETFVPKLSELRKTFRQHTHDERKQVLPAIQHALSEEEAQGIAEKMETDLAYAERARQRGEVPSLAVPDVADQQDTLAGKVVASAFETTDLAAKTAQQLSDVTAQTLTQQVAAPSIGTGFLFWDMWLGMTRQQNWPSTIRRDEHVIPLAEEVLTVGTRKVSTGTTRVTRQVVTTPVEKSVTLTQERVVVERRKPVTDKVTGQTFTELTVEVVETQDMPVVEKSVRIKEEIVVRTERTERTETVRDVLRSEEISVAQSVNKTDRRLETING